MAKQGKQFTVILEQDEDGYFVASVPALPGCHTQAKTISELKKRIKEVILLCLDIAKTDSVYQKTIKQAAYQPSFVGIEMIEV